MQICRPHWDTLRAAVGAKGMSDLVAQSGEEAVARIVTELKEGEAPLDPLMSANFMIFDRALNMGGLYLMGQDENGKQYCPLCEVNKHYPPTEELKAECKCAGGFKDSANCWIEGCTSAIRLTCIERGLIEA